MCRFLIIKSKIKFDPRSLLNSFALVCEKSIAPDGERQEDGFGIAWQENRSWKIIKSLSPIWKEKNIFEKIPETDLLVIHARGSGFEKDRGDIDFNEPFIDGELCFVFNGTIRGVKIKRNLAGKIGSQKLFSLIKDELKNKNAGESLTSVNRLLLKNAKEVEGMNIGLIQNGEITVLCQYSNKKDYYTLQYHQDSEVTLISSEIFGGYNWKQFKKGEVRAFV